MAAIAGFDWAASFLDYRGDGADLRFGCSCFVGSPGFISASFVLIPSMVMLGTIVRSAEFGKFVRIAPGVEGLLHVVGGAGELGLEGRHRRESGSEVRHG